MEDKLVLSEVLLKQFLELLDKQPKKDSKQLMVLFDEVLARRKPIAGSCV